jgi:hypothetical protein
MDESMVLAHQGRLQINTETAPQIVRTSKSHRGAKNSVGGLGLQHRNQS